MSKPKPKARPGRKPVENASGRMRSDAGRPDPAAEAEKRRIAATLAGLDELDAIAGDEGPPGAYDQFLKNIDEGRPERKLFVGLY